MSLASFLTQYARQPSPLAQVIAGGIGGYEEAQQLRQQKALREAQIAQTQAQTKAIPAQTALRMAQVRNTLAQMYTKNPLELYHLGKDIYNKNPQDPRLPLIGQMIGNASQPSHGISIGRDPSGNLSVQIGGQQGVTGSGLFGTPIVNPLTKAARGAKGMTYVDANTGKLYSTPSTQETTKLQQSVLGDKQLNNIVQTMIDDVHQADFFNPAAHLESWTAPVGKFIDPEAAQKRSNILGIRNKAVAAAERLMTMTNAPRTEENMNRSIAIFMPEVGETPESYKNRVSSNLALFIRNSHVAREALNKGVPLGEMPYMQVTLPPRSFDDYIHPRTEYVINPNYKGPMPTAPITPAKTAPGYTQADLEKTAKMYGMTVDQVRQEMERRKQKGGQ